MVWESKSLPGFRSRCSLSLPTVSLVSARIDYWWQDLQEIHFKGVAKKAKAPTWRAGFRSFAVQLLTPFQEMTHDRPTSKGPETYHFRSVKVKTRWAGFLLFSISSVPNRFQVASCCFHLFYESFQPISLFIHWLGLSLFQRNQVVET